MIAALLIAAALAQVQDTQPSIAGTSNLPNPNYAHSSVHVASVNNPMYLFPSGVCETTAMNGRLYKGMAIVGGAPDAGRKSDLAYAAASYGAAGDEAQRVQADVQGLFRFHPTTTVEFSPWAPVLNQQNSPASDSFSRAQEKMAVRAEAARQQWLKDNNYVGGVRTFVNDVAQPKDHAQAPTPAGTIQLNPEIPAFKSRMHVMGSIHEGTKVAGGDLIKVVRPEQPKAETKATTVAKADDKPTKTVAQK